MNASQPGTAARTRRPGVRQRDAHRPGDQPFRTFQNFAKPGRMPDSSFR